LDDELLTLSEAAALMGVSRQATRDRIRRGTLTAVPSARGPLVRRSAVTPGSPIRTAKAELAELRQRLIESEAENERLRHELVAMTELLARTGPIAGHERG
jgi:excisionase family DNA binding protein